MKKTKKTKKKSSSLNVGGSISVCGEICDETLADFVTDLNDINHTFGKSKYLIEVKITSPGGSADIALGMYDAIRASNHSVVTSVYGMAESAAVLLAQAGDIRVMTQHSRLMLHPIKLSTMDSSMHEIKEYTKECNRIFEAYCQLIGDRSGLGYDKIASICSKETYIPAPQALEMGLCDLILPARSF